MEIKVDDFFNQRITECHEKQRRLQNENCDDEANFEKIKANVYDIFKTIFSTAIKKDRDDCSKAQAFFMDRLEQILSDWVSAYKKAERHDDAKKMHIENIKINTARDVKENILQIWRENA